MKTRFAFALTLVAICAGMTARADDKQEIHTLYARLQSAISSKHPEATLALETPDFKATGPDGKARTGKELAQEMKIEAANARSTKMTIRITHLSIKGKRADVTTAFAYSGKVVDQKGDMGPKGKTHDMGVTGSEHNTLEKTAGGWKFKSLEDLPGGTMTVDGKPYDPSKMMGGGAAHKPGR